MRWGLLLKVECFRWGDLFLRRISTGERLGSRFQRSLWLYAALLRLRETDRERERERDLRDLRPLDLKDNMTTKSNAAVIKSDLQVLIFQKIGFYFFFFSLIFYLSLQTTKILVHFLRRLWSLKKKKKVTLPWSRPPLLWAAPGSWSSLVLPTWWAGSFASLWWLRFFFALGRLWGFSLFRF